MTPYDCGQSLKVKDSNPDHLGSSEFVISQMLIDRATIIIAKNMGFQLAYLHLIMAHCKCQGQIHVYFD